jgi:hypothetical protein
MDLLRPRVRAWNPWMQALACGIIFFTTFSVAQWYFADFLMTPAAANRFFGTIYRDFYTGANSLEARNLFLPREQNFAMLMWIALGASLVAARIGVAWGRWMQTVKR